jgi:hypothetical protein
MKRRGSSIGLFYHVDPSDAELDSLIARCKGHVPDTRTVLLLAFRVGDIMHPAGNLPKAHKEDTWS